MTYVKTIPVLFCGKTGLGEMKPSKNRKKFKAFKKFLYRLLGVI